MLGRHQPVAARGRVIEFRGPAIGVSAAPPLHGRRRGYGREVVVNVIAEHDQLAISFIVSLCVFPLLSPLPFDRASLQLFSQLWLSALHHRSRDVK